MKALGIMWGISFIVWVTVMAFQIYNLNENVYKLDEKFNKLERAIYQINN